VRRYAGLRPEDRNEADGAKDTPLPIGAYRQREVAQETLHAGMQPPHSLSRTFEPKLRCVMNDQHGLRLGSHARQGPLVMSRQQRLIVDRIVAEETVRSLERGIIFPAGFGKTLVRRPGHQPHDVLKSMAQPFVQLDRYSAHLLPG
jgi:hypothetical protein